MHAEFFSRLSNILRRIVLATYVTILRRKCNASSRSVLPQDGVPADVATDEGPESHIEFLLYITPERGCRKSITRLAEQLLLQ